MLFSVYVYALFSAGGYVELYFAVSKSEQGVVRSAAYVETGMDVSPALANENVARKNVLSVASFDAESLSTAVTAVLGRTDAFFMREEL